MYTLVVLLALGVASATYINEHRPDEGAEWSDVNHFFFGIATKYGYPAEHRNVTTEDGYILALHRIPYGRMCRGKSKGPVILMHGIALPGLSWIMSGTKKSLGFILADSCYDVWVPETRGVGQSDRHTHLHPDDPKYWDFSFHEKGLYDLKAIFDYILDETKASHLNYVGYDVGTTYLLVFLSLRPEYNKRVNGAYLLAPEAFQAPPKLPAFIFGSLSDLFLAVTRTLGLHSFVKPKDTYNNHLSLICTAVNSIRPSLCKILGSMIFGFNLSKTNQTTLAILMRHNFAGTSGKEITHIGQCMYKSTFQEFDYYVKNIDVYGQVKAPEYNLSLVTAPMHLYYGLNDWLTTAPAVHKLQKRLPHVKTSHAAEDKFFNHMDHLFATDIIEQEYDHLVMTMDENH